MENSNEALVASRLRQEITKQKYNESEKGEMGKKGGTMQREGGGGGG